MEKEQLRRIIMASIAIIEASSDRMAAEEASKIKKSIDDLTALSDTEEAHRIMDTASELDSSLISKYGVSFARVAETILIIAIAVKLYLLG